MRQHRVAIVTPYGASARYDNYAEFILAQVLRERGWDARMYTYAIRGIPTYQKDLVYKGVPTIRCRQRAGLSPKLFLSLLFFRPDTVICFHPKNLLMFTAMFSARALFARFIVEVVGILHDPYIVGDVDDPTNTMRDNPALITSFLGFLKRAGNEPMSGAWKNYVLHAPTAHADTVIAINGYEQELIRKIYGRTTERIYYAAPRGEGGEAATPPRGADRIPHGFLFFIGQIKRRKGWNTALSALSALRKTGRAAHLVFVTPDADTSEPEAYALEQDVLQDVTFLSSITNEERRWLYAHARYVLVPSTYEGFGLPVFEAFLAGKPVCATDIPVFREFLVDRRNAMLSPVGDGEALARSVSTLDADPALQERLRVSGMQTAKEFSYERMVEAHIKVFA